MTGPATRSSPEPHSTARSRAVVAAGLAVAIGAWLVFLLPERVIARGDDFGYIEAVVNSIRARAIVPSDWLEPLNVLLPVIGSAVWSVTENFWAATFGVTVVCAVVNVLLLRTWLVPVGWLDELMVLSVTVTPVWLNKSAEFTGVPLGMALTLASLLAWRAGAQKLFFSLCILACINRQSSVCLLMIPIIGVVRSWVDRREWQWRLLAGVLAVGVTLVATLCWLPRTFAQQLAAANWPAAPGTFAANVALGLVVCAGLRAGWFAIGGYSVAGAFRDNLRAPWVPLVVTALGAIVVLGGAAELRCETPGAESMGTLLVVIATFAGAWCGRWRDLPSLEMLAAVLAYVALVAWRGQWWDYYFLEPLLLLGVPARPAGESLIARGVLVALVLVAGCAYAARLGSYVRSCESKIVAYETAIRAGELRITEASDAPFGYLGWKLFGDVAPSHAGARTLSDFLKYVEGGRARWTDGALSVSREGGRRSLHPSGERWPLNPARADRRFPLNNREWVEALTAQEGGQRP